MQDRREYADWVRSIECDREICAIVKRQHKLDPATESKLRTI